MTHKTCCFKLRNNMYRHYSKLSQKDLEFVSRNYCSIIIKSFLVSSNDQVRCICRKNSSCGSKESYSSRSPCLKLKLSCSKSCRCRYYVNGKGRKADPFKDKLNSCRYRSWGKSESLTACSNTFEKYKSRCPCLKK